MIHILGHGQGSGAQAALVPGVIRISFDFDELSVLDMGQDAATAMASRSGRPGGRFKNAAFGLLHSPPPVLHYACTVPIADSAPDSG